MQGKLACLLALTFASSLLLSQGAARGPEPSEPAPATEREDEGAVAWDCVPNYWWGYWTWAWQPCAWLDPEYVEHTIGAVAQAEPTQDPAQLQAEADF